MRVLLILAAALTLAACSRPGGVAEESATAPAPLNALMAPGGAKQLAPAAEAAASADAAAAGPQAASTRPVVGPALPMLAYRYDYAIAAPPKAVRELVARHEAACVRAGPAICQVTGANVSERGEDRVSGKLSLRAQPAWLTRFRESLGGEAQAAGGRLVRAQSTSEDLSRQIVDTEAALRARATLRDRLQALLASRPGKLSELLEVERELARVQGEIDATQSELALMRSRVATSEMDITYESGGVLAPQGVWSPLGQAFEDFLGIVVLVLAGLVRLSAYLLPLAAIALGAFFLLRNRLPKRKAKPKGDGPTGSRQP